MVVTEWVLDRKQRASERHSLLLAAGKPDAPTIGFARRCNVDAKPTDRQNLRTLSIGVCGFFAVFHVHHEVRVAVDLEVELVLRCSHCANPEISGDTL